MIFYLSGSGDTRTLTAIIEFALRGSGDAKTWLLHKTFNI